MSKREKNARNLVAIKLRIAPSAHYSGPEKFVNRGSTLKTHETFSKYNNTSCRLNMKTRQSPVILGLCLRKIWAGKSPDYIGVIVFDKLRFQNVFCPHENAKPDFPVWSAFWKRSVFFRGGLVWTVCLTVEIKLYFQISPVQFDGAIVGNKKAFYCLV